MASGPSYKGVPTEGCLRCQGVFDGLFQVNAEAIPRTQLVPRHTDCPFVYSNRRLASNLIKSSIVAVVLYALHLVERHCGSRHAAQKYLVTSGIGSTDLLFKLRQRDALDFHVAALLIGDTIFRVEIIEGVGSILGMCRRA